jgi:hypothetical protein
MIKNKANSLRPSWINFNLAKLIHHKYQREIYTAFTIQEIRIEKNKYFQKWYFFIQTENNEGVEIYGVIFTTRKKKNG